MKIRSFVRLGLTFSLFIAGSPLAAGAMGAAAEPPIAIYRADAPVAPPAAQTVVARLSDHLCRKPWEAEATDDEALAGLKAKARGLGANGLVDVQFDRHRTDLKAACWQRVSVTGVAVVLAGR